MTDSAHNFAGMSLDERARLELESRLEGAKDRWAQIQQAIAGAPDEIETEDKAEDFTDVIRQLQALLKRVDEAHQDVKEPYLAAGRIVDSGANVLRERIRDVKGRLELALTRYQLRKQEAIERQRREEREREAADPEPAMVPHVQTDRKRSRVRSLAGAQAHLQDVLNVTIEDVTKIPLRYLNRPKVIQALISEITPDARKGDEIEGIKVERGAVSRVKT